MLKYLILAAAILVGGCSKTPDDGGYDTSVYLSGPEREYVGTNTVIVGMSPAHPPYVVTNGTNELDGISMDYLELVAKKTGLKYKIVTFNGLPDGIKMITDKKLDMITDIASTPERLKVMNFTEPYVSVGSTMMLRGLPVQYPLQIAYANSYAIEAYMKRVSGQVKLDPSINDEDAFEKLMFGKSGGAVMNYATADYFEEKYKKRFARSPVDFVYDYGFGVQKDNGILSLVLNKGLTAITQEEHEEIRSKWLSKEAGASANLNAGLNR